MSGKGKSGKGERRTPTPESSTGGNGYPRREKAGMPKTTWERVHGNCS